MKKKFIFKLTRKAMVYRWHQAFNLKSSHKLYEVLTRKVMIGEIQQNYLDNPTHLEYALTVEELAYALTIKNKEFDYMYGEDNPLVTKLVNKFILLFHADEKTVSLSDTMKEALKRYVPSGEHPLREDINHVLKGILHTRGEIYYDELEILFNRYFPEESLSERLPEAILFLSDIDYGSAVEYDHFYLDDDFTHYMPLVEKPVGKYSKESYISIGVNSFDLTNPIINEFHQELLIATTPFIASLYIGMIIDAHNQGTGINVHLNTLLYENERIKELYPIFISEVPLWQYKGDTASQMGKTYDELTFTLEQYPFDNDDPCGCGSGLRFHDCCLNQDLLLENKAILPMDLVPSFVSINMFLLKAMNEQYQHFDVEDSDIIYDVLEPKEITELQALLANEPDVFSNFKEDNVLSEEETEVVDALSNSIISNFAVLEYRDQKLVIGDYETDKKYLVSSPVVPFGLQLDHNKLPFLVKLSLVPFEDRIICDYLFDDSINKLDEDLKNALLKNFKDLPLITKFSDLNYNKNVN